MTRANLIVELIRTHRKAQTAARLGLTNSTVLLTQRASILEDAIRRAKRS